MRILRFIIIFSLVAFQPTLKTVIVYDQTHVFLSSGQSEMEVGSNFYLSRVDKAPHAKVETVVGHTQIKKVHLTSTKALIQHGVYRVSHEWSLFSTASAQSYYKPSVLFTKNQPLLFITAGQSNTEVGALFTNTDLTAPYQGPFTNVKYWVASDATPTGVFRTLYYQDQRNYASPMRTGSDSLQYANQFYLYPALANALGCTASSPLYVCAQSVGDTDLDTYWSSTAVGNTGYTQFVSRVNAAKTYLTGIYGVPPRVIFCLFDQGEKDGRDATKAANYGTNINAFITNLRTAIGEPNLKFVFPLIKLGSVNGSPNPVSLGATVNFYRQAAATGDPTKIITTDSNYGEPSTDGVHFTAAGQLAKNTGAGGNAGALRMSELQAIINAGWIPGTMSSAVPSGETYFNGVYNYVRFGDILDATLFTSASAQFRLGVTVWNPPTWGSRTLFSKFATSSGGQRTFHCLLNGNTLSFNYYRLATGTAVRGIQWTGLSTLYDGNEHTIEIRYDGTVSTNDGLDRVSLYIDGSLYTTGKTLASTVGTLGTGLADTNSQVAVGAIVRNDNNKDSNNFVAGGWMKDFYIQNGSAVDQLRCPNLATGTDTSGNGLNGTFN